MTSTQLRSEPYRLLFPLGIALAWAGVSPWLLLGVGATDEYRSIYHSLVQVQGFLASFIAGFLLTFVPRRTKTEPASWVEIAICMVCPVGVAVCAWLEEWAVSQMFWLVFAGTLFALAVRRFARSDAAPPATAAWIPASLLGSVVGSLLSAYGAVRPGGMWLHDVGRAMALQGFPAGLVLGAGAFLLPALTRGEPATATNKLVHVFAALVFFSSFFLEAWSLRAGFALRALVAAGVLVFAAGLHRPPAMPGAHRRLAWVAGWCVPLGFALIALLPQWKRILLHVTFLSGFGALTLAVSIHVAATHANRTPNAWLTRSLAALVALALGSRLLVELDRTRFSLWLAIGAASFLAATLAWTMTVAGALLTAPKPHGDGLPIRG